MNNPEQPVPLKLSQVVTYHPLILDRHRYALEIFNGSVFVEEPDDLATRIRGYRKEKAV